MALKGILGSGQNTRQSSVTLTTQPFLYSVSAVYLTVSTAHVTAELVMTRTGLNTHSGCVGWRAGTGWPGRAGVCGWRVPEVGGATVEFIPASLG